MPKFAVGDIVQVEDESGVFEVVYVSPHDTYTIQHTENQNQLATAEEELELVVSAAGLKSFVGDDSPRGTNYTLTLDGLSEQFAEFRHITPYEGERHSELVVFLPRTFWQHDGRPSEVTVRVEVAA